MNIGTATSEENPTHVYFGTRGFWITYTIIVLFCHFLLLSMPFFSTALAWTVTCVFHSAFTYIMLHNTKGTPFGTPEQGKARTQTTWEQIDCGQQFTPTRKFLTIVPIVLFFLASFYTKYDTVHFIFNLGALGLGVIPKLPQLHGVRIFELTSGKYPIRMLNNKWWTFQLSKTCF